MNKVFWQEKQLQQMTDQEWESLCDGCARCCLLKLEDEDTGELFFTNVSCALLNINACRCTDYSNRKSRQPECLDIRKMKLSEYQWLPETCAYRCLAEGRSLPSWHPLLTRDVNSVAEAGINVEGFAVSEEYIHADQLQDHIIDLSSD